MRRFHEGGPVRAFLLVRDVLCGVDGKVRDADGAQMQEQSIEFAE